MLVSWCFKPSQPQRITSRLNGVPIAAYEDHDTTIGFVRTAFVVVDVFSFLVSVVVSFVEAPFV